MIEWLAGWYPWPTSPGDDLIRAHELLGDRREPEAVVAAGYVAGAVAGVLCGILTLVSGAAATLALPFALCGALGVTHVIHTWPRLRVRLVRSRAIGTAPTLVARLVLRLQLSPTLESAVSFATEEFESTSEGSDPGAITRSLDRARMDPRATPGEALDAVGREWRGEFPPLARALSMLRAAPDASAGRRERLLDRAVNAVLEGARDRLADGLSRLEGPLAALYAGGVILPLALVGLVPAAAVAGYAVGLPAIVAIYDVGLPIVVTAGTVWILLNRPAVRPAPRATTRRLTTRQRRGRQARSLAIGMGGALVGYAVGFLLIGAWAGGLLTAGWGVGGGLLVHYRPLARRHRRTRRLERDLPDAMYLVGQQVADGRALEGAIEDAAGRLDGPAGAVFTEVANRQATLRLPASEALLGPQGPLAAVPGQRTRAVGRLIALAGRHGRPAGRSLVTMADHLDELQRVEDEMVRRLRRLTDRLGQTATVLGPLVAGGTLALAAAMGGAGVGSGMGALGGGDAGSGMGLLGASGDVLSPSDPAASGEGVATASVRPSPLGVPALGLAVGAYVCWLAVLLSGLQVGLVHGFDRGRAGYRIGLALLSATALYLGSFLAAGVVLNV